MLAGQLLRPWLQHLHTFGFVGSGGNRLKCTMSLKGRQQSKQSISSPFPLQLMSKRYRRQPGKTSARCPLQMRDNIPSHFSGSQTPSCFANPRKRFQLLLFLQQPKCLFSVPFSYLFYNITCCEPAGYPPSGADFLTERSLITFLWKTLKANIDTGGLGVGVRGSCTHRRCQWRGEKGICSFCRATIS